ncbi:MULTISPECIES: helix-turn-helix domain-containing protein [Bombella]|uniref:Sigma 54-interacting transcriptional regulator n=1 Tax=Bombella pollinis TaxID=2967337 RepID=A0ABT3WLP1_9PROT|nr:MULTISPECIES: helix-turn-helix domain-containing protein [Bombella]MCT6855302.1 sigma 54-interacting transcriptional regulator [Bombella apis]MCX5620060.1 sigma 54-interacting transcriptional regulator [Bombella pollinis]MUG90797.1 nitrogen assimilation regulator [Bombella sp. ESL0385]
MAERTAREARAMRPLFLHGASARERLDIAQQIHVHSPCAHGAFVVAGLTGVPRALREERLFGTAGNGWLEQAQGGTLLIDELDCLSPQMQHRFALFLAGRTHVRREERVRIIVASCHDHATLLRHGGLEDGLRHWLASLPVEQCLGPERLQAVGSLAAASKGGLAAMFEPVMRSYVRAGLEAGSCNLHNSVVGAVEKPLIMMVLQHTGGNQLKAAALLGLNRNTLRKRIQELQITIPRPPGAR